MKFTFKKLSIIPALIVSVNNYLYCQGDKGAVSNITNIRMGFTSMIFQDAKPQDAKAAIYVWADVLKKELSIEANLKSDLTTSIFNSTEEIKTALDNNEVEALCITTVDYFALKEKYKLVPYLAGVSEDSPYTQYIILTRNDSNIDNISDLFQKNLIQPRDKYHPMIDIWIGTLLSQKIKTEKKSFFRKIIFAEKEVDAIYSLFFKKADCAIVQKGVYDAICSLNSQFKNSLKIIQTSPDLMLVVNVYRKDCDARVKEVVHYIARNINKTPAGRNIMNLFKQKRLIEITDKELTNTKKLIDQYYKYYKN